jgi:hypothetical protein
MSLKSDCRVPDLGRKYSAIQHTRQSERADMEQTPTWLAAAVLAAGVTTVYNADDWDRAAPQPAATSPEEATLPRTLN